MLIKAKEDIKTLEKSGKIIGEVLSKLGKMCKAGVSTFDVDTAAEKMILDAGGRPAFKGYCASSTDTPFPGTICAPLNHEIVHGIPRPEIVLKNGDRKNDHKIVRKPLACSPCFIFGYHKLCHSIDCMANISPEEVFAACDALLKQEA